MTDEDITILGFEDNEFDFETTSTILDERIDELIAVNNNIYISNYLILLVVIIFVISRIFSKVFYF